MQYLLPNTSMTNPQSTLAKAKGFTGANINGLPTEYKLKKIIEAEGNNYIAAVDTAYDLLNK